MGCLLCRESSDKFDVDFGSNVDVCSTADDDDSWGRRGVEQKDRPRSDNYDNNHCATGQIQMNCRPPGEANRMSTDDRDGMKLDATRASETPEKNNIGMSDSVSVAKTRRAMETSGGGRARAKSSKRRRKRQKGVMSNDYGNLGAFLSLFVQGRRQSAVRIDTTKDAADHCNQAIVQSGRLIMVRGPERVQPPTSASVTESLYPINIISSSQDHWTNNLAQSRDRDQEQPASLHSAPNSTKTSAMDLLAAHNSSSSQLKHCQDDEESKRFETNSVCSAISNTESSKSGQHESVGDGELNDNDEAILFTNIRQLCSEILTDRLLKTACHKQNSDTLCLFLFGKPGSSKGELSFELVDHCSLIDVLADKYKLKNMIERAKHFRGDLVDQQWAHHRVCPLYHYIDVSALIVANIDDRIHEYNKLVARTLRIRREQLVVATSAERDGACNQERASCESKSSFDEDNNDENGNLSSKNGGGDDDEEKTDVDIQRSGENSVPNCGLDHQRDSSINSQLSSRSSSIYDNTASYNIDSKHDGSRDQENQAQQQQQQQAERKPSIDHHFGIVTLSTKQRSILQLKLIKYAACVTTRWIAILINKEINRIERKFKTLVSESLEAARATAKATSTTDLSEDEIDKTETSASQAAPFRVPSRIYLINLIPDQLNLFKSCLYLEQNLSFADFHRPIWAIKFERRTNIRVLKKERVIANSAKSNKKQKQSQQEQVHRTFHFKLSQIRFPTILVPTLSGNDTNKASSAAHKEPSGVAAEGSKKGTKAGEKLANDCDSLVKSLNEKLGPKYNETFAQQFKAVNKLTLLRYNPLDQCNGACCSSHPLSDDDYGEVRSCGAHNGFGQSNQASSGSHLSLPLVSNQHLSSSLDKLDTTQTGEEDHCRPLDTRSMQHLSASYTDLMQLKLIDDDSSANISLISPSPSHSDLGTQQIHGSGMARGKTHCIPKWAVELELMDGQSGATEDGQHYQSDQSSSSVDTRWFNRGNHNTNDADSIIPAEEYLHTYNPPLRAQCRSPLLFSGTSLGSLAQTERQFSLSGQQQQADGRYMLVPTQVAYANGKSQTILEVKRIHKRTFKCKTRSDLVKLDKLIHKARQYLTNDLDHWLGAAILSEMDKASNNTAHLAQGGSSHPKHHNNGANAMRWHHGHHLLSPSLVTYTIRVDLSRFGNNGTKHDIEHLSAPSQQFDGQTMLSTSMSADLKSGRGSVDAHYQGILRPIIRPASAMDTSRQSSSPQTDNLGDTGRAASSIGHYNYHQAQQNRAVSACGLLQQPMPIQGGNWKPNAQRDTSNGTGKRHVQFCLDPKASEQHNHAHRRAQKRIWIGETLFASCTDTKVVCLMSSFVEQLKAVSNVKNNNDSVR